MARTVRRSLTDAACDRYRPGVMDDVLRVAAPLVAAIASVVGVIIALDQLTQRGRMRRVSEWSKALAEGEQDRERQAVLTQVRTWAAAHMVASVMVPGRFYLEPALWLVAVPVAIVATARPDAFGSGAWWKWATYVVLLWHPFRRGIRVHMERYRIANEYFLGRVVHPPRLGIVDLMEGGTRSEFWWSAVLAVGTVAGSLGVAVFATDRNAPVGPLLALSGAALIWWGVSALRSRTPVLLAAGTPG